VEAGIGLTMMSLLFAAALLAGFVDTIAGGGGLITLPMLLLAQLPPVQALATNKLQGSFGTLTSSWSMLRRGLVRWNGVRGMFAASLLGAAAGTLAVQRVHPQALNIAIPIVLGVVGLYFLFSPRAGEREGQPRMGQRLYAGLVVPAIGFYDGFFGPGTGSFFSLGGVALRGQPLVTATAHTKMLNFASNIASLAVFVIGGKVLWVVGSVMVVGQMIGAWLGAHAVVRGGARLIRPLIVVMCALMLLRYAWERGLLSGLA